MFPPTSKVEFSAHEPLAGWLKRPMESRSSVCVFDQVPGEVVYIPEGYYHATMNLDPFVFGVGQQRCGAAFDGPGSFCSPPTPSHTGTPTPPSFFTLCPKDPSRCRVMSEVYFAAAEESQGEKANVRGGKAMRELLESYLIHLQTFAGNYQLHSMIGDLLVAFVGIRIEALKKWSLKNTHKKKPAGKSPKEFFLESDRAALELASQYSECEGQSDERVTRCITEAAVAAYRHGASLNPASFIDRLKLARGLSNFAMNSAQHGAPKTKEDQQNRLRFLLEAKDVCNAALEAMDSCENCKLADVKDGANEFLHHVQMAIDAEGELHVFSGDSGDLDHDEL